MSPHRPRITIRRLMIATAILGLGFGVAAWIGRLRRWSAEAENRAMMHRGRAAFADPNFLLRKYPGFLNAWPSPTPAQIESARRRFDHHSALADKYLRSARYPWLPIAADPPKPK